MADRSRTIADSFSITQSSEIRHRNKTILLHHVHDHCEIVPWMQVRFRHPFLNAERQRNERTFHPSAHDWRALLINQ